MSRLAAPRNLTAFCCILALSSFALACKKHQSASIPAPPTPARARVTKTRRVQNTANPPTAAQVPVAEASPRLGQILPAPEERRYNALIDQSLSRTQSSLKLLGNRNLTADQQSSLKQIQEFMRQAEVTRKVDLISANALADKAQVLARDLAASVR